MSFEGGECAEARASSSSTTPDVSPMSRALGLSVTGETTPTLSADATTQPATTQPSPAYVFPGASSSSESDDGIFCLCGSSRLSRVHGSEAQAHAPGGGGRDDEPVRVSRLEERRRAGRIVLSLAQAGSNQLSRVSVMIVRDYKSELDWRFCEASRGDTHGNARLGCDDCATTGGFS